MRNPKAALAYIKHPGNPQRCDASFTLARDLTLARLAEIDRIAYRHGFRPGGFRSCERAVSESEIGAIRRRAGAPRRHRANLQGKLL